MAEHKQDSKDEAVTPADTVDRVVGLSLNKDGTPDQVRPEIIGDKEAAKAVAKRQFSEQAVSNADDELRRQQALEDEVDQKQDPTVQKLQEAHEKAAKEGESKAESVVESLHKGA